VRASRKRREPAERLTIKIRPGERYSRAMSPKQAGAFTGMTGESMRALVRRMAGSNRTIEFDGIFAIKVGMLWRIRLDERWVEAEKA
jgi:hypothetical protein